jgi:hypothetical protein
MIMFHNYMTFVSSLTPFIGLFYLHVNINSIIIRSKLGNILGSLMNAKLIRFVC